MSNESSKDPLAQTLHFRSFHNTSELYTVVGIVTAITILVVLAGLFTRTMFSRAELMSVVIHTARIIQQLEQLLTDLSDAETEALVLSLDHYKAKLAKVDEDSMHLRLLAGDDKNPSPQLERVQEAVSEVRRVLDRIAALPHEPLPTARHLMSREELLSQRRIAMDTFHATVHRMREEAEEQLNVRVDALEDTMRHMVSLFVTGIVLTAALLGWLLRMIRVETGKRRMAQAALEHSYAQLENRVHERTRQLVAANARLASVSKRIIRVQEDERRTIARDLHDEIGQALTAVKLNVQQIVDMAKGARIEALVHDSLEILGELLQRVRGLALDLRPSLLDEMGLREATKWYLNKFGRRSGLTITFEADSSLKRLPDEIEIACFRVLQESLTNVIRHASATTVAVTLLQADDHLELVVRDNGIGFSFTETQTRGVNNTCYGLLGIEERLLLLGGVLNVESEKGAGTKLTAKFPIRTSELESYAPSEVAI